MSKALSAGSASAQPQPETDGLPDAGLFSHFPVLLWMSDLDGKACWTNRPPQEGEASWPDSLHPQDRVDRDDRFTSAFRAQRPFEMEYRVLRPDGGHRWVLETASSRFGSGGEFEGYAGVCVDITARRTAEDALLESNENFQILTRSTPNIAFIADTSGGLRFANDRWVAFTGVAFDRRTRWLDAVHPEDRNDCERRWLGALATGEGFDMECRLRGYGDRQERHLLRILPGVGEQPPNAWVGSATSIDGRKRIEAELQWSERMYRSLAEAIPALVLMTSCQGELQYCNARLLAYCGRSMDDLRGSAWSELIHPEDARRGASSWLQRVQAGRQYTAEYRIRAVDGEYRWHLGHTVPLKDDAGQIIGWLGATIDIHGRKQAEKRHRELAAANRSSLTASECTAEELRRANLAKDEFLSMVSHAMRTPITTIFGNAEILRRGAALPKEHQTSALADIAQESTRLQQMIDNMFVLARVEAGQAPPAELVLLPRVAERVIADHQLRHADRNLMLHSEPQMDTVCAETTYLEQVLRNLLTNAEKYSPPSEPIDVSVARDGDEIVVRVLDRGHGSDEAELDQLFMPFYRSPRTSRLASGAGIGLAVCKRLIESQGGRMWLAPRAGGGTEAAFALPVAEEEVPQ